MLTPIVIFTSKCPIGYITYGWQRVIAQHVRSKQGVLRCSMIGFTSVSVSQKLYYSEH